ncbi:MAG TPA: hypothetical protein VHU82_08100, partial [Vicinamibacterales bacterium]|nr:hypothetical protein [Vicinamibacterales bacterium]
DADATIHYEWQSSSDGGSTWNAISGAADSATYVLQASDVNSEIRVVATTSDPDNAASAAATSSATATVTAAPSLALTVSVIGNAPVQEGQQLVASATPDINDANAVVSYQWQSSGNGGLTWDNVTGATTGTAAGVTSSFYQLTEADEGKVFRAEASFTDVATGQPVSTTSAPTVAIADVTPVITIPFSFAADELSIVKNGSQIYDDTFAVAPPDSPTILSNGVPTAINYIMTGGTWTDVGGKAIMSSSGVALVPGTTTADITARLNTNTNPASTLGLKLGATFTASAKFDLTALPKGAYGITLTDASATQQADQVVRLLVQGFANGNTVVELEQAPLNGAPVILASQTLTADQLAGNNQIELDLSHVGGATAITGSFELIDQGTVTGTSTLAPTGTIFTGGITFTRAELDGFVAADSVLITGTPQEGQTLTALAAANDADATLHYAWQSSSDGGTTWNPIAGAADSANYIVQESDENNIIRVVATATDPDNNVTATAISAATAPVQDAPGAPEPPTLWGSFTFPAQPTDGTHFSGFSSFGRPAGANAIPFTFGATPTPFNPNGPDEITQNFLAFDPFMLPSTQGAQPLQTVDVAQFPYRAAMVYADTSPTTTEAITFYESQDQGDNTSIMQDVITGGLDPNGLLSVGTPTPIETGLTGTLYNLVAADRTPNNILSSYAIAWDTLNAAGTYDVQFQAFNADGRASSPIVTLLGQGEAPGSAITATPAWQFRGGGGAYIEALASHDPVANQDFLQFTGFGLDGNTDGQSFVVTPDLDAYAAGATNHITQEVAPGSTRPLTEIQFTQFGLGNATNRYAIAWNETVVDAAGTHDQVEFAIYDPTSNSVVSHSTFQIADGNAQNIQVATFNNGGQTVAALVYGDNVATNLIEFDQNGDKLGAVTDNTPAIAGPTEIFGDGRVGLSFNETLDAGGTSQIVTHVYDLRTTGVHINDANLANGTDQYVAGTQFNDVFGGENGVDNTYYYVGRDAANGPAPTDSFTGGAGGWNVAIMPDAASNYTIADNPNGSVTLTNTGDPAHAGSLILNNVQAIAFAPTQDPSGDTGSLAATGNELLVLGPLPNGGEAITIDLGTTLGLNTANAGDIQFAGSGGMLLLGPQASVTGTVLGFTGQDQLDFAGITAGASASLLFTPNNGGGVLSVSDGTTTASLVLAGDFTPSSFTAASDGHGGTLARLVSPS